MKKFYLLLVLAILTVSAASAQRRITGKITDSSDGQPIPFVTITVKGTSVGATSDEKGDYSINVPQGQKTLVFNCAGYVTAELEIFPVSDVRNAALEKSELIIDQVVITGFQNIKKETFTGSSVKIAAEDLELGGSMDPSRMLEGKVAGIIVQNVSSTFGSSPKIRIRGATSINGENKPLWVVDGVVLEDMVNISNDQLSSGDPTTLLGSSVAGLNSNDIESFDILKDASATALYGARAMNGVIVITTKRGKTGAPRIIYSNNITIRTRPRYENYDILNSADQMAVYSEMERKGLFNQDIVNKSNWGVYGLMYNQINTYLESEGRFGLKNDVESRRNFLTKYAKNNTDWFKELFTNQIQQEHSLSISAGGDKSRTYASFSFMNDAGWTIADKVNKYTFNFRNDYEISRKISVAFQGTANYRDQDVPGTFSREQNTVSGEWSRDFDINPFSYALNTSRALRPYDDNGNLEYVQMNYAPFNIINELRENRMNVKVIDAKFQGEFNYTIIPNLRYNFIGSLRYTKSDIRHTVTERSNAALSYRYSEISKIRENNPMLWQDPEDPNAEKISVMPDGGFYNTTGQTMLNYTMRNSLYYNKMWSGNYIHEFSIVGGNEIRSYDNLTEKNVTPGVLHYGGNVVVVNSDYYRMAADRKTRLASISNSYFRAAAFYFNANYAFDKRYTMDASFRYDGSNQQGKGASERWLPTWTIGARWNIMNEQFMERVSETLNVLSLRASYGLSASMPMNISSGAVYRSTQSFAPGYIQNMISIESLANQSLTWEKMKQFNIALETEFFQGRLNFTFDYFDRRSFDLIQWVRTSGIGGESQKQSNYADLISSGFDISLGGAPIRKKDWRWLTNLTFGFSKNQIMHATNLPDANELVKQQGGNKNRYPVNGLFSLQFTGLDPETGIPQFINENGDPDGDFYMQSNFTDFLKYEGQIDPKFIGGLNNTVSWKGLSLNVFLTYQWGNVVRMTPRYKANYSDLEAMTSDFKNRWVMTGDEKTTTIPGIADKQIQSMFLGGVYSYVAYNYSDARVARGDYIKLKSVSLSWDLPEAWLAPTKVFQTASLRVTGRDLWLLYADKKLNGQDPEFFNTGGVAYPSQTQVIFSLTLGF